jgi:hypothetical protein
MGIPLQELQRKTTSREFVRWMVKRKRDLNRLDPLIQQIKVLTAEVRRSWVKNKKQPKASDFDQTYEFKCADPDDDLAEEQIEIQLANSKAFWSGLISRLPPAPKVPPQAK